MYLGVSDPSLKINYIAIAIISTFSVFSNVLNFSALLAVLKKTKNCSYFLINLFLSSIATITIGALIVLDEVNVIGLQGVWLCGIVSGCERIPSAILTLSVAGLSYESSNSLQTQRKFSLKKVFCLTWGVAGILSFPLVFTSEYFTPENGIPICRKKPLLGSIEVKALYEGLIYSTFEVFPAVYIFYRLYKTTLLLNYIFPYQGNLPRSLLAKLTRLRLQFLYSGIFILNWLPFGMVNVVKMVLENPTREIRYESSSAPPLQTVVNCFSAIVLITHPLIYIYAHYGVAAMDVLKSWLYCTRILAEHQRLMAAMQEQIALVNLSGILTYHASNEGVIEGAV